MRREEPQSRFLQPTGTRDAQSVPDTTPAASPYPVPQSSHLFADYRVEIIYHRLQNDTFPTWQNLSLLLRQLHAHAEANSPRWGE